MDPERDEGASEQVSGGNDGRWLCDSSSYMYCILHIYLVKCSAREHEYQFKYNLFCNVCNAMSTSISRRRQV